MGLGFKIFLYGFLGMVASILIYNLVRLFRSIKPVECHAGKLLSQQVEKNTADSGLIEKISAEVREENLRKAPLKEIDQPGKEKPKRLWKGLWESEESLKLHRFWERHRREEEKRLNDDFSCGLTPSGIRDRLRENFRGEKF